MKDVRYHYHEGLTPNGADEFVYQMKVVYTNLYLKHADEEKTNIHYYAVPNGEILVDFMELMIYHSLDIESIEITKV
jgi:hypothetical protein